MAWGWFFVPVMLFIIVCGSYILPVVLVGIVSISFNEATYRAEQLQEMYTGMQEVIDKASKELPDFFDPEVEWNRLPWKRIYICLFPGRYNLLQLFVCTHNVFLTIFLTILYHSSRAPFPLNHQRMHAIRAVFDEMDADGGAMVLDVHEMNLFCRYCFQSLFDVELSADEVAGLFHLMVS